MPATSARTPRARPGRGPAGRWSPMANWSRRSTATGAWSRSTSRRRCKDKAAAAGAGVSPADVLQATRDSVRAIMMIRAFRMRGHLHANLDPLGIAKPLEDYNELSPDGLRLHRGRLRPADLHRQGAGARIRHHPSDDGDPDAHLLLDARRRIHAHLRSRGEGLDPGAHRGAGQGHRLHAAGQEGDPAEADRGRGLRAVHRRQVQGHQALRPRRRRSADPGARADHQARRLARPEGNRARHGPSRPPQRAHPGHGQAAPRDLPRVQGRLLSPPTTSRARAT